MLTCLVLDPLEVIRANWGLEALLLNLTQETATCLNNSILFLMLSTLLLSMRWILRLVSILKVNNSSVAEGHHLLYDREAPFELRI
jgi:hypothetical protein